MQLITIKKGGIIMNYIGVDLHKRSSYIYILDKNGNKILNKRLSNNIIQLKEFFNEVEKPFKLAVETTYNWYFFVDLAQEYSDEIYLANSYELKAFATGKSGSHPSYWLLNFTSHSFILIIKTI